MYKRQIQDRGYVRTRGSALIPTWLAFAVTRLLEEHFTELVDYDFTASMEEDLDRIANGDEHRAEWLRRFYFGDEASSGQGLRELVEDLGEIDAREISTINLGDGLVVRLSLIHIYVYKRPVCAVLACSSKSVPSRASPPYPREDPSRRTGLAS